MKGMRTVLVSRRVVDVPELRAHLATHAVLHSSYRLHAVHNEQVVCEDAVIIPTVQRRGRLGRPIATLLLEGAARITVGATRAWLEPGDVLAMDAKGDIVMRQEGPRYAAFAFEWDPERLGPRPAPFTRGRLSPRAFDDVRGAWERCVQRGGDVDAVETVLCALRDDVGLPLARAWREDLTEDVPPNHARLCAALDATLSHLRDQPMLSDLESELGLSTRQVNRLVLEFNERYGFNAAGWRDARNRRRLLVGLTLLSCEGATAERVARAVGYRSLAAFTRALTDAGFPPPSTIPAAIAAARDFSG